ncbi:hypothetical protein [Nakamurella lactea]|uniref:hypothetical protein n=1 Tax=Nakamurella lactea TaxID=459515 RepID=UPI00048AA5D4|nr:hypothetical protein [Nakamurella lactea]
MIDRLTYSALAALSVVIRAAFGPPESTDDEKSDRGDVPGWVMITVMTAIVVIALLAVFREQVLNAVKSAFDKVNDSGKTK